MSTTELPRKPIVYREETPRWYNLYTQYMYAPEHQQLREDMKRFHGAMYFLAIESIAKDQASKEP